VGFPKRDEVVRFILEHVPETATLPDVIEALCRLQIDQSPGYIRERLKEMAEEIPLDQLVLGTRLPAVPTRQEVYELVAAPDNERDGLVFRVLYATGMRVGELVVLRFCDLNYEAGTILIRSGKDDVDRYAVADRTTMSALAEWQKGRSPSKRIFELGVSGVQRMMKKWAKQTGLLAKYDAMGRRLSPHSFRHAFATHCYENGCDLLALKYLLGHEFITTTELYIETGVERWRAAYLAAHEFAREHSSV